MPFSLPQLSRNQKVLYGLAGAGTILGGIGLVFALTPKREVSSGSVSHLERLDLRDAVLEPPLQELLSWWSLNGPWPLTIADHGGGRWSEAEQAFLFARGVTKAASLKQTPHGVRRRGSQRVVCAIDCAPYEQNARGKWVIKYPQPNDSLYEKLRLENKFAEYGRIAKGFGLVWGGDFTTIHDLPHVETRDWRQLPMGI